MRAAILAGGKGVRIAKKFPELPKPMIPLNGRPILHHQVEMLVKQGVADITLIVGYKAGVIRNYFGNGEKFGAKINYIVEESPLGTGGGLALLPREDTVVLFGDIFLDVDIKRFISWHREKDAHITLFTHPNSHMCDSDIVVCDSDNKVVSWASKKVLNRGEFRNLTNAGIYVFSATALPEGGIVKCDLEHDIIIPKLQYGKIYAYRSSEYVKDMGTPERLMQVEYDITAGITSAKSLRNKQKAIFLDRDGTINVLDGYVTNAEQIRLIDGAAEAIKRINQSEYLAICITNQPIIARGDITFEELNSIHAKLDTLLGEHGAYLDDLFFCPHHPDSGFSGERKEYKIECSCRKPKPGLIQEASKRYNIDLSQSYMIGDSEKDITAGIAAGCKTQLVNNTYTLINVIVELGLKR